MANGKDRRKAYLSLWTKFMMQGNQDDGDVACAADGEDFQPLSHAEIAVYMISPAGKGGVIISSPAAAAYETITVGCSESAANKILAGLILEEGELMIMPDKNLRRRYFQIADNAQFWLEFQRASSNWTVARKSPLEAKTVWHRYPSHQIALPLE